MTTAVKEKPKLCEMKVTRDENGVVLYIKSPILEEHFKKASNGVVRANTQKHWNVGGFFYFLEESISIPERIKYPIYETMYCGIKIIDKSNNYYDFSFIKSVGIKDGMTFTIAGILSKKDIEDFSLDFTKFIRSFSVQFMGKFKFEVSINIV